VQQNIAETAKMMASIKDAAWRLPERDAGEGSQKGSDDHPRKCGTPTRAPLRPNINKKS